MFVFGPPDVQKMRQKRDFQGLIKVLGYLKGDVRQSAMNALAEMGQSVVDPLISTLQAADPNVRIAAAMILGRIGDPRAAQPMVALLTDSNSAVRLYVAEALGELGDVRAVDPLVARLKDGDQTVSRNAAAALGRLGSSNAVEPLCAALKDERSIVRSRAAEALGQIGDPHAVEPLLDALQDIVPHVRSSAAEALNKIAASGSLEESALSQLTTQIRKAEKYKDPKLADYYIFSVDIDLFILLEHAFPNIHGFDAQIHSHIALFNTYNSPGRTADGRQLNVTLDDLHLLTRGPWGVVVPKDVLPWFNKLNDPLFAYKDYKKYMRLGSDHLEYVKLKAYSLHLEKRPQSVMSVAHDILQYMEGRKKYHEAMLK